MGKIRDIYDGIVNVVSNLNVSGKAKTPASNFNNFRKIEPVEMTNIYRGCGFGRMIVEKPAQEMLREWITIEGDKDDTISNYLVNTLKAKNQFTNLARWARLYGGALIFMGINDGGDLIDPVNENNIKSIDFLRVIDRTRLSFEVLDFYNDPNDPNFGQLQFYTINPILIGGQAIRRDIGRIKVHESRILRMDGEAVPESVWYANGGWGDSVLQTIYAELVNLIQSYDYSSEILHDFILQVLSIDGLSAMLQTKKGDQALKKRLETINLTKSLVNMVLMDKEEEYQKVASSVSGLRELIDKFTSAMSAVSGIPRLVLMGESPSGLAAKGDNSIRSWYDTIKAEQEDVLKPLFHRLIYLLTKSKNLSPKQDINNLNIKFNPLWQYDEPTMVDMRNKQAQSDEIYIQTGVLEPDEVATSRFGTVENPQYSFDTELTNNRDDSFDKLTPAEDKDNKNADTQTNTATSQG